MTSAQVAGLRWGTWVAVAAGSFAALEVHALLAGVPTLTDTVRRALGVDPPRLYGDWAAGVLLGAAVAVAVHLGRRP